MKYETAQFQKDGTWIAPDGITKVILLGRAKGSQGLQIVFLEVVPHSAYAITIGDKATFGSSIAFIQGPECVEGNSDTGEIIVVCLA